MCRPRLRGGMDWDEEVPRLARLARLDVPPAAAPALARACEAITRDFAALATYAEALPAPPDPPMGALRADDAAPASDAERQGILAAAPRVDPATRAVIAARGRG